MIWWTVSVSDLIKSLLNMCKAADWLFFSGDFKKCPNVQFYFMYQMLKKKGGWTVISTISFVASKDPISIESYYLLKC